MLLVTTDVSDAREEKIQALHNLIPVSVLSLDVLLHPTEDDLGLHGGLRGSRGDRTGNKATITRIEAPQRGSSRVAKPPEYSNHATEPTHNTESFDAAPVMQTTQFRRLGRSIPLQT